MQFADTEYESEQQSWPIEGLQPGRDSTKKNLEARRLIERRMELKRLRDLLEEPDLGDFD